MNNSFQNEYVHESSANVQELYRESISHTSNQIDFNIGNIKYSILHCVYKHSKLLSYADIYNKN